MSVKCMALVWAASPYKGAELLLHLALADFSNDQGISWPSLETLARKIRGSKRHVRRSLRSLEEAGFLTTESRFSDGDQSSNKYLLVLSKLSMEDILSVEDINSVRGDKSSKKRVKNVLLTISEPSIEPSVSKKKKSVRDLPEDFQPNDTNLKIANDLNVNLADELPRFLDHHRSKGSQFADWNFALNTWLRNSARFANRSKRPWEQVAPVKGSSVPDGLAEMRARRANGGDEKTTAKITQLFQH